MFQKNVPLIFRRLAQAILVLYAISAITACAAEPLTPIETVGHLYDAIQNNDADAASLLYHPERPNAGEQIFSMLGVHVSDSSIVHLETNEELSNEETVYIVSALELTPEYVSKNKSLQIQTSYRHHADSIADVLTGVRQSLGTIEA